MKLEANAIGVATAPADGINLGRYPGLTHAPAQHGEGIRFAHNGRPVDDLISTDASKTSAAVIVGALDNAAEALGVSFADVLDALKYLRDASKI